MNKSIILTGNKGLIGKSLEYQLKKNNYTVIGFDITGSVIPANSTTLLTTLGFNITDFEACLDFYH